MSCLFYCVKERGGNINEIYGVIYCAVNVGNDKRYIGQTTRELKRRRNEHIAQANNGSELAIHQAIRKYGEDSFKWSAIDQAYNQEDLDEKEIYWIDYYDTFYTGGYNMARGGQFNLSDYPDEMSAMRGGREFLVFDLDGNFVREVISQTEFADEIGVSPKTVNHVLMNRKNSTRGYILMFKDEFSEEELKYKMKRVRNRPFYVFKKDGFTLVGKWNNREQCQNETGVNRKTITRYLNHENMNNSSKYLFYYGNDIPNKYKYKTKGVV